MISIILILIIVPVAVTLPRHRQSGGLTSAFIVPLYVYPDPNAWEPMYEALDSHPELNFVLIINPNSGPGNSQYPNEDFIPGIQKLNSYNNVQTLGYIPTKNAKRDINAVLQDVSTYSGWSTYNGTSLAMRGIFFDEAPSEYSAAKVQYMETINSAVKDASGLQQNRMVVHNPGTIPDARFEDVNTDVTVVYEDSYSKFQPQEAALASLPDSRSRYSYMLNSVPMNNNLQDFVDSISIHAQFLFLTSLTQSYYESFGPHWEQVIDVIPT